MCFLIDGMDIKSWPRRAWGNAIVLAHAAGEWLESEESAARARRRDARLRRMIRYAAAHVPHYREMFAQSAIDPRSIRGVADLSRLPIVDKATLRADPGAFLARTRAGRTAFTLQTSGTTGEPSLIRHDRRSLLANIAFGGRARALTAPSGPEKCEPPNGPSNGPQRMLAINYPGSTTRCISEFYDRWTWIPVRPESRTLSVEDSIEQVAAEIESFRPHLLASYGGYLETFLPIVHERGLLRHRPARIVYGAEGMSAEGKKFIENELGIPVFSQYSAVESLQIATTCERRDGFHLHEDLCHVRILDESGRDVPAGQSGRVVISNLLNRATVLLNYELGDVASLSEAPCPCGRSGTLLRRIEGRSEDIVWLRDGSFVHPRALWAVLKKEPGLLRFQIRQSEIDRFELLVLLTDDCDPRGFFDKAGSRLREVLRGAHVEMRQVSDLGLHEPGKHRPVIALGRRQAAAAGR